MMTSKQKLTILYLLTSGSLVFGLILYVVFREHTFVAQFVEKAVPLTFFRIKIKSLENDVMKFYLPDFLWSFSFSGCLHLVTIPNIRGSFVCGLSAGCFGILFEVLQHFCVVNGTADIMDAVLYLLAGVLFSTMYIILFQKEKE